MPFIEIQQWFCFIIIFFVKVYFDGCYTLLIEPVAYQRIVHLFPEPGGIRLVKGAPKPLQGVLPDALSRLSASDLTHLNALLSSVARNMKVRDVSGKTSLLADI